jgi:3',5'-cyclic AMP phosphodiesterase CpdA
MKIWSNRTDCCLFFLFRCWSFSDADVTGEDSHIKLYAISDLHLSSIENRQALEALPDYLDDWLILAGDIGETEKHLRFALETLTKKFAQLLWVPGNHDLWADMTQPQSPRGEARYMMLVSLCRHYGVLTPEDPYVRWPGEGSYLLAPLFLLYDYSFRPADISLEGALDWATQAGCVFSDEIVLDPTPYPSRIAWCQARCQLTEQRLAEVSTPETPFILINHFPLQEYPLGFTRLRPISLWSGTRTTEHWHTRFAASVAIYGHLHMRATYYRDGVRFEEVSLGYPRDWQQGKGIQHYLREILPGPRGQQPHSANIIWHR